MANIASAKKDARRSLRRAIANRALRSAVKTRISKARRAVAEGGETVAQLAVEAVAGLDRAAAKGVIHANNAARRKSRLMKRLNAAPAAAAAEAPARATRATRGKAQAARGSQKAPVSPAPKPARTRKPKTA